MDKDSINFEYTIKDYNKENMFVTVQVYSKLFKKPKENYPYYNIGIQDISSKEVFKEVLELKCGDLVQQILLEEDQQRTQEISETIDEIKLKTWFVTNENKQIKKINITKRKQIKGKTFEVIV